MSTQELLKDFLVFLKKPHTTPLILSNKQRFVQTIRLWSCLFIFIIFGGVILDSLIDVPMHDRFQEVMDQIGLWGFIGFAVLLGPLLEEITFRLAMRFQLRYILIGAIALTLYIVQATSSLIEKFASDGLYYLYSFAAIGLVTFIAMCIKYKKSMASGWVTYFPLIFYVLSFAFAMIHIFNFEEFPLRVILLAPIITLPQFILGLGMGYLRMRFGFWYGCLFHVLNNSFALSVYLLLG